MPLRLSCTLGGAASQTPCSPRDRRSPDSPLERRGRADERAVTTKGICYFVFVGGGLFGSWEVAHRLTPEISHRIQKRSCLGTSWGPSYDHICIILYCIIPYYTVLDYTTLYDTILQYTRLHTTIRNYTLPYCIILYRIIQGVTILCHTIFTL